MSAPRVFSDPWGPEPARARWNSPQETTEVPCWASCQEPPSHAAVGISQPMMERCRLGRGACQPAGSVLVQDVALRSDVPDFRGGMGRGVCQPPGAQLVQDLALRSNVGKDVRRRLDPGQNSHLQHGDLNPVCGPIPSCRAMVPGPSPSGERPLVPEDCRRHFPLDEPIFPGRILPESGPPLIAQVPSRRHNVPSRHSPRGLASFPMDSGASVLPPSGPPSIGQVQSRRHYTEPSSPSNPSARLRADGRDRGVGHPGRHQSMSTQQHANPLTHVGEMLLSPHRGASIFGN